MTSAVLERWVGRSASGRGRTDRTTTTLLGSNRRRKHAEGRAEGLATGRAEGLATGRAGLARMILASRGIQVTKGFPAPTHQAALAWASDEAVFSARECRGESEADFLARLE